MEREKGNTLIKNFVEAPQKVFANLDMVKYLTPNEFMLYIVLLNQGEGFSPSMRWAAELLNVSFTVARNTVNMLRSKGFIEIMPTEDKFYIWFVNDVALNPEIHKDFLNKETKTLDKERDERNKGIDLQIAKLEQKLALTDNVEEKNEIIEKLIKLQRRRRWAFQYHW